MSDEHKVHTCSGTDCEVCALRAQLATAERRATTASTALEKINGIRNSIVGTQTINWSEHIYPLVAALEEAGVKGMGYDAARPYYGSLIDRAVKAEDGLTAARAQAAALEGEAGAMRSALNAQLVEPASGGDDFCDGAIFCQSCGNSAKTADAIEHDQTGCSYIQIRAALSGTAGIRAAEVIAAAREHDAALKAQEEFSCPHCEPPCQCHKADVTLDERVERSTARLRAALAALDGGGESK